MRLCLELRVIAVVLALAVPSPSPAAALDTKSVGPGTSCVPYGPDTTFAELQFSQTGVYNPGTTAEKVLCQVIHDQEGAYQALDSLRVRVDYRVLGGASARMTCTLFIGSSNFQTEPVYSSTASGGLVNSGNRSYLQVQGGTQQLNYNNVPSTLLCSIPPKTSMASIIYYEWGITNSPS